MEFPISGILSSFIFLFLLCSTDSVFNRCIYSCPCMEICNFVQPLCRDESCTVNGLPGIGRYLRECVPVYIDFLNGCPVCVRGYYFFEPIVCCPLNEPIQPEPGPNMIIATEPTSTTTTTTTSTTIEPTSTTTTTTTSTTTEPTSTTTTTTTEPTSTTTTTTTEPTSTTTPAIDSRAIVEQKCKDHHKISGDIMTKIAGGTKVKIPKYPFMTAVFGGSSLKNKTFMCGGTLISERYVLTAAHCTYAANFGNATWIRVGDLNLNTTDDDTRIQYVQIIERLNHPLYKKPILYHDIALLKLEKNVIFNIWVLPVCLPYTFLNASNAIATAIGWGATAFEGKPSDVLLEVNLPLIPQPVCNERILGNSTNYRLPDGIANLWQICAGAFGKDTCQGDSGGPLMVSDAKYDGMYNLLGVTSAGGPCNAGNPGIYTNAFCYVSWIQSIVWPQGNESQIELVCNRTIV